MRARAKPASKGETAAPAAGSAGERPLPGAATGVSRREAPALLMAAVACFWGALYLYVPILTPYAETLGASMTLLGLIVSSYGFSQLVLRIPVGIWSDRIGRRKPFIAAGYIAAVLAGLGLALSRGPYGVLAARTLSGVAATMWVVITVLFSSYFPPHRAGYAMSLINFATTLTQLAATLGGGLIAEAWGWQAPFWGAAVIGGVGLVLTVPLREAAPARPAGLRIGELTAVGRERSLLAVSLLAALYQFHTWVTVYGFTPNYAAGLGATKAQLGWLSLVSTLPTAIASLGTGSFLARRFNERQMVVAGFWMAAFATLAIPFMAALPPLFVTQAVGGFGRGLIFPVLMGLAIKTVPEEKRATAMGFFQSIYALGMFGGPVFAGFAAEFWGLPGAFWAATAVTAIGALGSMAALGPGRTAP
ncbi:MAG: MFS transporter [Firmicutes bacterium]|nr:MFS transporter [Bacillota bacterium]MBO2521801.1 MFS transporter [Bacillota bacterium]